MVNEGLRNEEALRPENIGEEQVEDVEALKQALAEMRAKAASNLAGWQRAQADFENYRRRSEQEREETTRFASSALILAILPILDDFERAFISLPSELANVAWVDGIRLIERKLRAALEAKGLTAIEALGKPFDPRWHEAIKQDKGKEGIVIKELEKGYKLRDRVIRPSKVIVGNGEE